MNDLHITLGSHLFPIEDTENKVGAHNIFMCESHDLAAHYKYHKLKIHFFFTSMRRYAAMLGKKRTVHYYFLGPQQSDRSKKIHAKANLKLTFFEQLSQHCTIHDVKTMSIFYPEDRFFHEKLLAFGQENSIKITLLPSPLFINTPDDFQLYIKDKKPFLKTYYEKQRIQHKILVDNNNKPLHGKWSFDEDNRKKIPKGTKLPATLTPHKKTSTHEAVTQTIESLFENHPGSLKNQWYATTTQEARVHLQNFLHERFQQFGDFQDALDLNNPFLFHSVISPYINSGLLPAKEVLETVLHFGQKHAVPMNSLEGFVRQLLGWREFVFGIDQTFGQEQETRNFFQHKRGLADTWYNANTGLEILDNCIQKALDFGYNHHIERLMVVGNLMLLCEIEPKAAFSWFMEMYIDSADWVMGPNVYGMSLFSDGGIFATKPYICGSNYILKQSHLKKGPWQDSMDGLYWRFIEKNKEFFKSQHRSSMMVRQLEKLNPERKERIYAAADAFLLKNTLL